ncbi:MAG: 2-dehydro-3-deoxygalactonokinase [Lunatimonas sp.]|uniref:2-dehydro-3-deoxygalactonokinase n=1 Tax=Lunatimonas sp. TaxID=2060141 RepID=UPI00263A5168|nr:2-dehydro-3-deoxygalactonokinase [Lunatimonas sp.]MCC5939558.1 2-dehydro-3-deoxygalactonokinase [Lunatimonas sp.]
MVRFISCDWGTTSFRLKLVDTADLKVLSEISNEMGVAKVNRMFLDSLVGKGPSREDFFKETLAKGLNELQQASGEDLSGLMIICSGMASSSIGLRELAFTPIPFNVSGRDLNMDFIGVTDAFPNSLILLSGLKSDCDVMRGEETQLIGIIQDYKSFGGDGVFIFPGTHSKHITVIDGHVVDFTTYMTGEMFEVVGQHSILRNSISANSDLSVADHLAAFRKGVREGYSEPLLSTLFKVRTQELFNTYTPEQNYHYLSGILIGSELKNLAKDSGFPTYLCGTSGVFYPYQLAFETLELLAVTISKEMVEKSVVSGQYKIFNQNLNHERSIFLGSF